jgi:hypothetical protein
MSWAVTATLVERETATPHRGPRWTHSTAFRVLAASEVNTGWVADQTTIP